MKFYFELQLKRAKRKLEDIGIHPYLGFALGILGFVLMSGYLFSAIQYASWVFSVLAVTLLFRLSEIERNDQLRLIFRTKEYIQLRFIENGVLLVPFLLVLMYYNHLIVAGALIVFGGLLAITGKFKSRSFSVYTPFKKIPFEFIVGFRRFYGVLLVIYFLILKSVEVDNFNLGLFSLGLIFLIAMASYITPEEKYFVWIFSVDSKNFLKHKIVYGLIGSSVLSVLALCVLCFYFSEEILMILMIQCLGYVFLATVILAKYAAYPKEISLAQGLLIGLSLWFPPMLLGVLPFLYVRSKQKLELILHD